MSTFNDNMHYDTIKNCILKAGVTISENPENITDLQCTLGSSGALEFSLSIIGFQASSFLYKHLIVHTIT